MGSEHRIIFEGVEMPPAAMSIDVLGFKLPGISEETSDWLWRFTICVGRHRSDTSANVLRACRETLELSEHHRDEVIATLGGTEDKRRRQYEEWTWTLKHIIAVAKERDECQWTAPMVPGDQHYGKSPEEIASFMQRGLELLIRNARPKRWWQFWK